MIIVRSPAVRRQVLAPRHRRRCLSITAAAVAVRLPAYAAASVIIALAPLAVLAIALGSGRKESNVSAR